MLNKTRAPRAFVLSFEGIPGATLDVVGLGDTAHDTVLLIAEPDSVATYRIFVRAARRQVIDESMPVTFTLSDPSRGESVMYESVFRGPTR